MKHILKYEWLSFRRNTALPAAWLLMLVVGLYAIYYGKSFTDTQLKTIYSIDTAAQARLQNQLANFDADTSTKEGKTKYVSAHDSYLNEWYVRPMAWKQPAGTQFLSLGQSDNQPFYYSLWISFNVYNTKQVEIRNPDKLMAGNFDLAFVVLYLLPLFAIAITYNILSTDRENGTANLLSIQGPSLHRIALGRIGFRFALTALLILIWILAAQIVAPFSAGAALAWLAISLLYILFWFALAYLFTAWKNAGAVNALGLIGIWIILLIVIPSLMNSRQKPNERAWIDIADAGREFGGRIWEMKPAVLADSLFSVRPDWKPAFEKKGDSSQLRSVAYAYFSMTNLNRIGQGIDSTAVAALHRAERDNWINPVFGAQLLYNKLAGTEISHFAQFRKNLSDYQHNRYERIVPRELADEKQTKEEFLSVAPFQQPGQSLGLGDWLTDAGPLLLLTILLIIAGKLSWTISQNQTKSSTYESRNRSNRTVKAI